MSDAGLDQGTEIRFQLLDKLINVFRSYPKEDLQHWTNKVKQEVLIKQAGCTEEVAEQWINQALART